MALQSKLSEETSELPRSDLAGPISPRSPAPQNVFQQSLLVPPLVSLGYLGGFAVLVFGFTTAYTLVLPFSYTLRLSFANWDYLTPELGVFAVAFGVLLAWVVICQVYTVRRAAGRARGTGTTLAGAMLGVLPSMVCCTTLIPTLLGLLGASAGTGFGTSVGIQAFFALHRTWFLVAGVVLLGASAGWATRRLRRAGCRPCEPDGASATIGELPHANGALDAQPEKV